MLAEQQAETLAFLRDAAAPGSPVETRETHISIVVLAGARVFKLKRAVRLGYVDFSTPEKRLAACKRELLLNRRTAPALYRAVRRITRADDGRLAFDGPGRLVDAVVEMARFDEDTLFDRLAMRGRLTPRLMTELAGAVARFHGEAAVDGGERGAAIMAGVLGINERALATTKLFEPGAVEAFNRSFRAAQARHAALLDRRQAKGCVRLCHGDLHLRNICLVDGVPTLFDCLEFDAAMATIDVLYDLAFLLMDLWHRDLAPLANLALNRYLDARNETDGLALLPYFMAVRAAVRAHVDATTAEAGAGDVAALRDEARAYFDLALDLLRPRPPRLVAIGGFSGSGKSTVAAGIAAELGPPPGARVLSSDRIRKRLFNVAAETRLPESAYRPETSQEVYGRLFDEARAALGLGYGVVAEAVFDRAEDRTAIAEIAAVLGVPFTGIWLDAPVERLVERIGGRQGDPSDATERIVRAQLARAPGPIAWRRIDAAGDIAATLAAVRAAIG